MSHSKKAIFSVLSLAFPIIIENILQTLLGTTDTYFAGQLTDTAIAGISVTNIVMNIFISFFTAISIGTTAIVSRNYGKKDFSKANHSIAQALLLGVFLGGAVGLLCLLFYKPILRLSGADATVMRYAAPYFLIVAVPSVFLCLQQVLASCLRAMQDTRSPMYATGTANLLNIILNACFIHGGWGVVGLALATTLSRIISMLLLFYRLYLHDPRITLRLADFKIHKKTMQALLTVGIPAGVEKLIMRIGQLIYNGMIISIGVNAYVAHNIAGTIESYSYIPAMGFGYFHLGWHSSGGAKPAASRTKHLAGVSFIYPLYGCYRRFILYFCQPSCRSFYFNHRNTRHGRECASYYCSVSTFFRPCSGYDQRLTRRWRHQISHVRYAHWHLGYPPGHRLWFSCFYESGLARRLVCLCSGSGG